VWAHWKVEQDQKGNEKTQTSIESFNKFNYRVDLLLKLSDGSSVFSQVPPTLAPAKVPMHSSDMPLLDFGANATEIFATTTK
jgi:hypothetical protein